MKFSFSTKNTSLLFCQKNHENVGVHFWGICKYNVPNMKFYFSAKNASHFVEKIVKMLGIIFGVFVNTLVIPNVKFSSSLCSRSSSIAVKEGLILDKKTLVIEWRRDWRRRMKRFKKRSRKYCRGS